MREAGPPSPSRAGYRQNLRNFHSQKGRDVGPYTGYSRVSGGGANLAFIDRRRAVRSALVGILAALSLAVAVQAAQPDVFVDVVINGVRIEDGGLVVGDRTYVKLDDVAAVLGGKVVRDTQLNLIFLNTGRYANLTLEGLKALNPDLQAYSATSALVPAVGIRHGVQGPHIAVTTTPAGVVTGVVLVVPEGVGPYRPWYDQPAGSPVEVPGVGRAYTQQMFVIDRTLVRPSLAFELVFNGERLWVPETAFLWRGNDLYVRLRDLAEASGGGVGWNQQTRTASAKVVPGGELTPEKLVALNPNLQDFYKMRNSYVPGQGLEFRPAGAGLAVGLDETGAVTRFSAAFPEGAGWFSWYDQDQGAPLIVTGLGRIYTQNLALTEAK